jgi:hypothetical protein
MAELTFNFANFARRHMIWTIIRVNSACLLRSGLRLVLALILAGGGQLFAADASSIATGLKGKLIVGYQGWFGCPQDFEDNKDWQHWFVKAVRPEFLTVDMLPSMKDIQIEDQCDTGLARADGQGTVKLFSSQNPRVVATHFNWMREHNMDGVAAQRFVSELASAAKKRRTDNVLRNIRAAAEASGRTFFLTYDVSGANPKTVVNDIREDWKHIVSTLQLTDSPNYLRDKGKPVVQLWGFGFNGRPGSADEVFSLISDLKNGGDLLRPSTLVGGVPTYWRTLSQDSKSDPKWADVYRSYDVISPWSVGRFGDEKGADNFIQKLVIPDLAEAKRHGLGYMPVIFPGFSWYNLMTNRNLPARAILNQTPRQCGQFFWSQASGLMAAGVDTLYAAMFDEVDESTALFPMVTDAGSLPKDSKMVYLNKDGCALPADWYMRVTGLAAKKLRQKEVPSRKLNDELR